MKKRNTLLKLCLALIMSCTLIATGAMADDICSTCDKGTPGKVNVPGSSTAVDAQGNSTTTTEPAYPFDFDGSLYTRLTNLAAASAMGAGFGPYGYCPNKDYNISDNNMRNNKLIFDVCECPQASSIKSGTTIGIQIEILTTGVYFAEDINTLLFDIGESVDTDLCLKDANNGYRAANRVIREFNTPTNLLGQKVATAALEAGAPVDQARAFNNIKFYKNISGTVPNTIATPTSAALTTALPAANMAKILQNDVGTHNAGVETVLGDYMFTYKDMESINHCNLWIDVPAMRLNPSEITTALMGSNIEIAVRILFNRNAEGICLKADTCECVFVVGTIGCDASISTDTGCMFFPYVVQGDSTWGTGVAVTAINGLPTDKTPSVTFAVTDAAGNKAAYTTAPAGAVWAFMLDAEMMAKFSGANLTAGAASLMVTTNYNVDGFMFVTDGNFGASVLPRGCGADRCAP